MFTQSIRVCLYIAMVCTVPPASASASASDPSIEDRVAKKFETELGVEVVDVEINNPENPLFLAGKIIFQNPLTPEKELVKEVFVYTPTMVFNCIVIADSPVFNRSPYHGLAIDFCGMKKAGYGTSLW